MLQAYGMIQRIQSLYLLLAVLLSAGYFFFPFSIKIFEEPEGDAIYRLLLHGVKHPDGSVRTQYLLLALCSLLILTLLVTLFLYKNRPLQIRLCWFSILICLAIITADYFLSDAMGNHQGKAKAAYMLASYVPLVQLLLIRLAVRGIKKDEEFVRSADRIR
jgi:hypothetical protein